MKRRNKIVQEITRNVANVFSFYAIIANEHVFQCINIHQVPWEVLKTEAFGLGFQHLPRDLANKTEACGLGFQYLPRDLANVKAWKAMFDSYNALQTLLAFCLGLSST